MNCFEPPPLLFIILTHSVHVFSVPAYLIALLSLISLKSRVFNTYKLFLIWHLIENLCFELFAAFLLVPAVNPPYPVLRTTGILSRAGISGLVQFYIVSLSLEFNGISINEMFYFRYKASLLNFREHKFTLFLRFFIYLTRSVAAFDVIFSILTYEAALDSQRVQKTSLLESDPSARFLACPSVYIITPACDLISSTLLLTWILQALVPLFIVPGTVVYISRNVHKTISAATWKIQQQLLRSLTIQTAIHGVMLGIPNLMFIYAFSFGFKEETLGYFAFLCLIYHGFVSTLAMIVFTRPLRDYILEVLKLKRRTTTKISVSSS